MRHNEENADGIDATVLWREASTGYGGGRYERHGKDIGRNDCSVCNDGQSDRGSFHGRSRLVDLLACEHSAARGCVLFFCVHKVNITRRCSKAADLNMKHRHPGTNDVWLWRDEVLGTWVRETSNEVVPAVITPTTSESRSCLQTCGQERCSRRNLNLQ